MYLVLFFVGIVLAFAGAMLVRYGVPVVDAASSALFTSGIMAFVGGTVMVGLSAVVRTLSRIAERLEMAPVPVPPIASVGRDDPAPRPVRTPPAAVPPEPSKSSLLGWFGRGSAQASGQAPARPEAAPAAVAPGVDLGPLTRVPEEPRPAPVPAPSPAPTPAPAPAPAVAVKPAPVAPKPAPAVKPAAKPATANGSPDATIYKSGVIDGMAYTLFMDGSIEAELPQGRVKFASVEDLQKHILGIQ
jgi:hypothetical protein